MNQYKRSYRFAKFLYGLAPNSIKRDYDLICQISAQLDGVGFSQTIVNALIVAEDHRFYKHPGFDLIAIARAIWSILVRRRIQGASTIEQQFVRKITGRYELTIIRRVREIYLAIMLSFTYKKEVIARHYLSVAYFGWQMNGLREASKRLSFNPEFPSQEDAAKIIARLRYPEPEVSSDLRKAQIWDRTEYILAKMGKRSNGT